MIRFPLFSFRFFVFLLPQHGRVKVRTTAEQEAAKRKEREQKRIAYLKLRDGIFAKVHWKRKLAWMHRKEAAV